MRSVAGFTATAISSPFLRELGFDAVETPVGPETQTDELRDHIARCVGAGLKVSLHPYSEGTIANSLYFSPGRE